MPDIDHRWVPDDHAAALAARSEPEPVEADDDEPKRATRKRAGGKAETAMIEQPEARD